MSNFNEKLIEGLAPALPVQEVGRIFVDTTQSLAVKINEEISNTFNLPEIDNIIFTPRIARNNVGASEFIATAYFTTKNNAGNIFYKGKGNNRLSGGGRLNMVSTAGNAAGGSGPFGTSDHFRQVIKPLCKVNDNGKPIMNIKVVPESNNLASIELDPYALFAIALGIKPGDPYDYDIANVNPINDTSNFSITFYKYIISGSSRKGRNTQVNYARIEQSQYAKYNGGNKNGRNY